MNARIVDATRIVTTSGLYAGESGTGYDWGRQSPMGDVSAETRGRYQGYREPCRIELLHADAEIIDTERFGRLLSLPGQLDPLTADEAIAAGVARVVAD